MNVERTLVNAFTKWFSQYLSPLGVSPSIFALAVRLESCVKVKSKTGKVLFWSSTTDFEKQYYRK